jgi:hypothetical protein
MKRRRDWQGGSVANRMRIGEQEAGTIRRNRERSVGSQVFSVHVYVNLTKKCTHDASVLQEVGSTPFPAEAVFGEKRHASLQHAPSEGHADVGCA